MPQPTEARRAITTSALALLLATGAALQFVPPLQAPTQAAPWRALAAAGLAVLALGVHWLSLARAARALGRSVPGWLTLALLAPVGGAAALLLLGDLAQAGEPRPAPVR